VGEIDVQRKGLGQALMSGKFLTVVHRQGVPHPSGYGLEGADSGLVQGRRTLVSRYRKAGKCEKSRILDEYLALSGGKSRKYAIFKLNQDGRIIAGMCRFKGNAHK
jgi:hypothetical protein